MTAALHFIGYWALAFVTLAAALVLLNIFDGIIGNDLVLGGVRKEVLIAALASLIEGVGLWLVISYVPMAHRALIIPALIVALIYKIGHLEDWSRYDVIMLLFFQGVIGAVAAALFFGQFQLALMVLLVFAFALGVVADFVRDL